MDASDKGKSEGASERVEDGRASTKSFNADAEQETGEEVDEAQEDGEKQPKRRYNRSFSTVLDRVVIYSFSCTLFFRIIHR
jgi:hypothetical protein